MLIDLPQETIQIITQKAQTQGISVAQLLSQAFDDEPELSLNSDLTGVSLNNEQFAKVLARLEQPPKKNAKLQALLFNETPLAQKIHQRFSGIYINNNEFDLDNFLPSRDNYPKRLNF